jgi:hypothetical protein
VLCVEEEAADRILGLDGDGGGWWWRSMAIQATVRGGSESRARRKHGRGGEMEQGPAPARRCTGIRPASPHGAAATGSTLSSAR